MIKRRLSAGHSEFIGNVAVMMSGKTVAALIALFTTPIVARLFSPSDFGVAAFFTSVVLIVSNGATLRYEAALSLPKEDVEAIAIMALAYRILIAVCIALLLLITAYELTGLQWAGLDLLGHWKWLLPLAVMLMSALHVQESWLTRTKSFTVASASLVVGNATTGLTRIGLGYFQGSSIYGLIVTYLVGLASRLIVQRSASSMGARALFSRIDWPTVRAVARRYADFPKFNAPAGVVYAIGGNLPVLLFGVIFSPAVAGFYAMANRLSHMPLTIVANSMRRVFLQKAAAIRNRGGSLRKAFLLLTGGLVLLGIVPFAVLWLFGEPLLTLLLGARWTVAGQYLEIMAPWLFSVWVAAPCNAVFIVLREQRFFLLRQTILTVLRAIAFAIAYLATGKPEWTLHGFVIVTVLTNVVTILHALRMISRHDARPRDIQ